MLTIRFLFLITALTYSSNAFCNSINAINGWRYIPQVQEKWEIFENSLNNENFSEASSTLNAYSKENIMSSLAERDLGYSMLCLRLGLKGCGYIYSLDVARKYPGSAPSLKAWMQIENFSLEFKSDEDEVMRLINLGNFSDVPEKLLGFFNYYLALGNMKKGFYAWADINKKNIPESSIWDTKFKFIQVLEQLNDANIADSLDRLSTLESKSNDYLYIKNQIALQRARLLFESHRMKEAEDIYSKFLFSSRETGRALLERAWIRYFDKDYSVSLGMLESLKSSYFSVAINPEQYVLSMLSYRDLCHYKAVKKISKDFNQRFNIAIEHIKQNKPLSANNDLMWMALQKSYFQSEADLISALRADIRTLKTRSPLDKLTTELILKRIISYEAELKFKMNHKIQKVLEIQAEKLLDVSDQVKLVEYISNLDEYRLAKVFEERSYKSEQAENLAIQTLFWPVGTEYWWEELIKYRVIISDRCQAPEVKK